jgi:hypothetical protein
MCLFVFLFSLECLMLDLGLLGELVFHVGQNLLVLQLVMSDFKRVFQFVFSQRLLV